MSSTSDVDQDPATSRLSEEQKNILLDVAEAAIEYALQYGRPPELEIDAFDPELQRPGATFVTLRKKGSLRGCIGTVHAVRPLVVDVAYNAVHAALDDPRFPPLGADELPDLEIQISLLSPMKRIAFVSEADLLDQLRPGIDGLELEYGTKRGVFLPDVWESLPEPTMFLANLKMKAGLPPTFWSDQIRVYRFTTEHFSRFVSR